MNMYYYPDKKNTIPFGSLMKTINSNKNQNTYSSRSKSQVATHKMKNNKEKYLGIFSSFNATKNISKSKYRDNKTILFEKDKEINELMIKLKECKDKLNYIKNQNSFMTNTNNSTFNSCNMSKTRSSTALTERNINSINPLIKFKRECKTKPACNLSKNKNVYSISSNNNRNQLIGSKNKNKNIIIRPKSSNYDKNLNCIPKNTNKKTKISYSCNAKKPVYKNYNKNIRINNIHTVNKSNLNNTYKILSIESTKKIYEDIFEKTKNIFEMIKNVTTG